MRLYITVWEDAEDGLSYKFSGTQADQRLLVRTINMTAVALGHSIIRAEEIEVPTDKAGLLTFLNTYRLHPDGLDEAKDAPTAEEGRLAL